MNSDSHEKSPGPQRRVWPYIVVTTLVGLVVGAFFLHQFRTAPLPPGVPQEGSPPVEFIIRILEYLAVCVFAVFCGLFGWALGYTVRKLCPLRHQAQNV
jgi:H+/Cl- antiporter ClcA